MQLGQPVAQQVAELDRGPRQHPVDERAAVVDPDAAATRSTRDGSRPEHRDLGGQLARQPDVVVVAERDQLAARGEDAAVAAAGQPGLAVVA